MNKQQLANKIWASANRMRSKIDANEYKDYILGLVFYKFLSDNEVNYILKDMKNASDEDKQQALMSLVENYDDENSKIIIDYCKNNIGYFIEYKNLFSTWLLPESNFTVSDLSVALNSFDRLVSQNYKPVYDGIFKTLQAGLSKLGENPASQTRALKDLVKLIKGFFLCSCQIPWNIHKGLISYIFIHFLEYIIFFTMGIHYFCTYKWLFSTLFITIFP